LVKLIVAYQRAWEFGEDKSIKVRKVIDNQEGIAAILSIDLYADDSDEDSIDNELSLKNKQELAGQLDSVLLNYSVEYEDDAVDVVGTEANPSEISILDHLPSLNYFTQTLQGYADQVYYPSLGLAPQ